MHDADWLARQFESQRPRLRAVAYRMLGSLTDAEDAVQEAWIRLSRSDAAAIDNLNAWLTTVVGRMSLNILQSRKSRREEPDLPHIPDPIVTLDDRLDLEHEAIIAESVGLALLVVLDRLEPAERIAFVMHDMFGLSFAEIAPIVDRSPAATRKLASRARQRVRLSSVPNPDRMQQQRVADAFLAAAREGDFERLLSLLDPNVVLRIDGGSLRPGASREVHGAHAVVAGAMRFGPLVPLAQPVLVNGAPGFVGRTQDGRVLSVVGLTIQDGKVMEMNVLTDPERLRKLNVPAPTTDAWTPPPRPA
jgi:RNA polymerase sigma-70 factor (ECF subfamily)